MRLRSIVSCLASAAVMSLVGRATAGVFQDGSFESVSSPYAVNPLLFGSAAGWSVNFNGGGVGEYGDNDVVYSGIEGASDGSEAVMFDADSTSGVGSIYQSFSTLAGKTYTVGFDYGQYGGQHFVSNTLAVNVLSGSSPTAGTALINPGASVSYNPAKTGDLSLTDSAGSLSIGDSGAQGTPVDLPAPNTELSSFAFTFTAQSTTSTIVFTDTSAGNVPFDDGILDNVQIPAAVPEPTSMALVIFGAAALCRRRRRSLKQAR
jgi:hypothetical protein